MEGVGDLAVGQSFEMGETHDLALVVGELVERRPNLEGFPRPLERNGQHHLVGVAECLGSRARFTSVDVDRGPFA